MGEIIPSLSRAAEPQLCLFIVRVGAQAIQPALAQLVRRHSETGLPELFQRSDSFLLFRPCGIIIAENESGFPIRIYHLPVGLEVQHFFVLRIIHLFILKGEFSQPDTLRLLNDHILDRSELLLLGQRQTLPGLVLVVVLQLIP